MHLQQVNMQERTMCCNWSSAWLFGGPKFESQTPIHIRTFSSVPVYFWEHTGTCSPDVGALSRGVQFKELSCEGHMPKPLLLSRYIVMSAANFSPYHGSARPLQGLIHRPYWATVSVVLWTSVIRTKAVCMPKDKGNPATKFYSSHLQFILLPKLHIPHYHTILCQPIHAHISPICEPPFFCYKLCDPLTKSCPTTNPRPRARIPLSAWAFTVNQATKVYLSLVVLVHWHPSKTRCAYT